MTISINEIRDWKHYMVNTRHNKRVSEQKIDQSFVDDTFLIPHIKKPEYQIRTGFVAEMMNGFTQQLIASLPKAYTKPTLVKGKITKERETASERIASKVNQWCYQLSRETQNPFKETFKRLAFTRGEAWIYVPHKPDLAMWEGTTPWQDIYPDEPPVYFLLYDPLVVFHDPSEDIKGKPTRVVVSYKRLANDIHASYPRWNKYESSLPNREVNFLYFVNKDIMYAEADEEALFRDADGALANGDGRKTNIYGCVPFAHAYSGFGSENERREPSLLAFSRTRMIRGKVKEDASMAADFSYNIHAFAFRHRTFINKSGQAVSPDFKKDYHPDDPGKLSILEIPAGSDMTVEDTQVFDAPVFAYRQQVRNDLALAYPAPLRGIASGTSGRQEDILSEAGLSFYDSPVENNSTLWSEAMEIALKVIWATGGLIPNDLHIDDNESYSQIIVHTKRDDPLARLRDAADGDRKYQLGIIDAETNLVDYQKKTQEQARQIMARLLVDDVTRNNPVVRELMGITLAREMGVEQEYAQLAAQMMGQSGMNPPAQFGSQGGAPREGNIQTQRGMEEMDLSMQRTPRRAPPAGV